MQPKSSSPWARNASALETSCTPRGTRRWEARAAWVKMEAAAVATTSALDTGALPAKRG
jgi:hypothetical protein